MSDCPNNRALSQSAFLGPAVTVDPFRMYDGGSFPYVSTVDPAYPIHGELYSVSEYEWDFIEQIEGFPVHYDRIETKVVVGDEIHDAAMYCVHHPMNLPELTSGEWHGGIILHEGYYCFADGAIHGPFDSMDQAVGKVGAFSKMVVGRLLTRG